MKKNFTLFKMMLLAIFTMAGMSVYGQTTVDFTFSEQGYTNAQTVTDGTIDANLDFIATKGGTNDPKYYDSGAGLRVYNTGSFIIAPKNDVTVTGITLTFSTTGYTFNSADPNPTIWSGSSKTNVVFSVGRTCRLQKVSVTYSSETIADDATLASLKVDAEDVVGFDAATETYTYEVAYSDANIPVISATTNSSKATATITQATAVPGSATVLVTAEDGTTTKTYTVNFTKATASSDATLASILVDETPISNFISTAYEYAHNVAIGEVNLPIIKATANHEYASVVINQATGSGEANAATVVVTAEDGSTALTYKVVFVETEMNDGTKERPFTVDEAIEKQGLAGSHWVAGYIVGIPKSGSNLGGTVNSAIAISDSPASTFSTLAEGWIPVALPSGEVRNTLNLIDNPENLGKKVKLYGTLEAYFSVAGVKTVSDFELLTPVGVEDDKSEGTIITTDENNIIVKADQAATVYVYSVSGKLVATSQVTEGSVIIPASKGVYVVKTDNKVAKVVL